MCSKGVVPEIFYQFFQNIPTDNQVTDTVPDVHLQEESEEET